MHDLGLESFCEAVSGDAKERRLIENILSQITDDADVAAYRRQIFADILHLPELRKTMTELFDKIQFMKDFSTMHKSSDEEIGLWHLFHRLDELDDYIRTVEAMRECLSDARIQSAGLTALRDYITGLYDDACFAEMKKDIAALKMNASDVQSVTLGVNVNERFEAVSIGLVSVNKKPFKKSGIVSNFADAITSKDKLRDTADWDGDMHYQVIDREEKRGILDAVRDDFLAVRTSLSVGAGSTTVNAMADDATANSTFYLDTVVTKILSSLVRKLRNTLTKYANVAIVNVFGLVPEFIYYIRCAEFISGLIEKGCVFCEAQTETADVTSMSAKGFYNLKLALNTENVSEIVPNDLAFDQEHTVYILTGANRGGKTTITQAVGQLFVLAQGAINSGLSTKPMTMRDYFGDSLGIDYYYRHPRSYVRRGIFSMDEPSPTVRGVNRPMPEGYKIHANDPVKSKEGIRPLTTLERSYIQTFPRDFLFFGSKTDVEQMIGNAVPVNLAKFVGEAIKKYLANPHQRRNLEIDFDQWETGTRLASYASEQLPHN